MASVAFMWFYPADARLLAELLRNARKRPAHFEGDPMSTRRPRLMSTLQGISLTLTVWTGLSFCGVRGLVSALRPEFGGWFWLSLVVWITFPALYVLDFLRYRHVKWVALVVGLVTMGIEYSAHWRGLFYPGSQEEIAQYYAYYDMLYLFGPFDDRIAPTLYYVCLDFMILTLIWISLKRVALRAYH